MDNFLPEPEKVWVIPRSALLALLGGPPTGIWTNDLAPVLALAEAQGYFMLRDAAEIDESHLQIIPYVCLQRDDQIFTVTRLAKQGEARLHGRISIGIGGHLNPEDGTPPFWPGLKRELMEEIAISVDSGTLLPIGVILDDSTPVGRVHCGIAFLLDLPSQITVDICETDKMHGSWQSLAAIEADVDRLETWSAWLLPWLRTHQ